MHIVVTMKDLFARHTPVRNVGSLVWKKIADDTAFTLNYISRNKATLSVMLSFGSSKLLIPLYSLGLFFCLACGRFLGFGTRYELCWICESELEQLEDIAEV
jgi:hypothetical protein